MTKNELLKRMKDTNPDREFMEELQNQLNDELCKPVSEQDYDMIDELTEAISILNGSDKMIKQRSGTGIQQIFTRIRPQKKRKQIRQVITRVAVACAVVIISINIWSYSAYGMNAFSAAYQMLNGGIRVDLTVQDDSVPVADNQFEEEMRSICQEHGIKALIPKYIPAGFTKDEFIDYYGTDLSNNLYFYFKKEKTNLSLQIQIYNEDSEITPVMIPSDTQQVTEQTIQGNLIRVFKEDQEYRALFMIDRTQYLLYANRLDYDECQRVLQSMFE